jgi:hypothetical protein
VEIAGYDRRMQTSLTKSFQFGPKEALMLESDYQRDLIVELKHRFPGCVVIKNDPSYIQGFPDLLILWHDLWAALEVKASGRAAERPNQGYYVDLLNNMSFAAFIYPENEEEVLDALQRTFQPRRPTRIPKR